MKLVIFNGPVCSGKSTIIGNVMAQKERYFHLSYDSLKWQFSHYASGKYYEDIRVLRFAMLKTLLELNYNVVTESLHKESRKKHAEIASLFDCDVVEINLEAEYDVLLERWKERMSSGERRENISRERFDEIYQIYLAEKNNGAVTFRTDKQSMEEIRMAVLKLL